MTIKNTNEEKLILDIQDLNLYFQSEQEKIHALKNINLKIKSGQIIGIAGESGCGKTLTSLALMDLLPHNATYDALKLSFDGKDLKSMPKKIRHSISGLEISMIFQDPMASLNPSLTIETQIIELLSRKESNKNIKKKKLQAQAIHLLAQVGITSPEKRLKSYPFELSGGMCQRVMIAMALSCNPKLLIADEPTTGLDVTIQAQILALLKSLQQERDLTVIFISHDLSILANLCDEIYVMYAGTIVEKAKAKDLIRNPIHPYTKGLLACLPRPNQQGKLSTIPGIVPDLKDQNKGCPFLNRCPYSTDQCKTFTPIIDDQSNQHYYNCHLSQEILEENKWN